MIIYPESLFPFIELFQFSQERKVFFRVLHMSQIVLGQPYLLRILSDHEHESEIVHSQGDIVKLINIG